MRKVQLGLRENAGLFSILVLMSAFVGAMVGFERSPPARAYQRIGPSLKWRAHPHHGRGIRAEQSDRKSIYGKINRRNWEESARYY